ncbi:neurensin-1 [Scleropages formosus]|uniref:Neurensin 1 n=1 Tax=Scleropages formosus TaxID=113540 RepID=A0A8C9VQ41_SCLFO|nr:neurensin-1-like [Scleropages formosus]
MWRMASCSEIFGSEHVEQGRSHHPRYGVRSYLHHFYEECATSIWERDEDFQVKRSPSRCSSVLWKVFLACGTLVLTLGVTVLTVGYAIPPRIETFGEEELQFVDSQAVRFNRALDTCKLAGGVTFCIGGTLAAAGLLLFAFSGGGHDKEQRLLQRSSKEQLAERSTTGSPVTRAPALREGKVPVTLSKVRSIQPKSRS